MRQREEMLDSVPVENRPNIKVLKNVAEQWRRIVGTNYLVSSEGRFVCTYHGDHLVEPHYHKPTKHYRIKIGSKFYMPQRLVWEAFNGKIPQDYCVINKHGYNSFWDLASLKLISELERNTMAGNRNKVKRVIDLNTGKIYKSAVDCSKKLFVAPNYVRSLASGYSSSPNFNLRYIEGSRYE